MEEFQGNTSSNSLGLLVSNTSIRSVSSLSVSRDGSLLYAVSSSNNALSVLNTSGLTSAGTYTTTSLTAANPMAPSDTLAGASAVAVSQNDQFVYVASESGGTLTVLERNLSTNALTWVQTLQDGVNGARGLAGATAVAVSDDGQYVYVTSGQDGSLAVYGIQSDGALVLDQVLGGEPGLVEPSALAVEPANGNVYVASQAGLDSGAGGLASFTPAPTATPHSLALSYSNMQTLNVQVGNSDNFIGETQYATTGPGTSTPVQLNITAGNGGNTISLPSIDGTTTVDTGTGPNQVTVNASQPQHHADHQRRRRQ